MNFDARLYTLKPLDFRRPRPCSNLRPLEIVYGFLFLCGPKREVSMDKRRKEKPEYNTPMPKCLYASRAVLTPLNNTVLAPVGARRASWSRVSTSPPALTMRSRAAWVNRRAATVIFGTVVRRMSSVTVPTWTMTFELRSGVLEVSFTIRERERGGRLFLERKRRRRITYLRQKKLSDWIGLILEICTNLVEAGIGTTGEETVKLVIIKEINDDIKENTKARRPLQGEADTGPRSLVLCGYPSWRGGLWCRYPTYVYMSIIREHRGWRAHHLGCCRNTIFGTVGIVWRRLDELCSGQIKFKLRSNRSIVGVIGSFRTALNKVEMKFWYIQVQERIQWTWRYLSIHTKESQRGKDKRLEMVGGVQTKPNSSFCWTIMVSRVRNQRCAVADDSFSTETTPHPLSTLILTRTMRLQHQPLLNVTLPLHVAGLVLVVLLVRAPMVTLPMAIVDPIEVHLLIVVGLLPGAPLRPQLFVHSPHLQF